MKYEQQPIPQAEKKNGGKQESSGENTAISRLKEQLGFLNYSLAGRKIEDVQQMLDGLRTEKDSLMKKQQEIMSPSDARYQEAEKKLGKIDMEMREIFSITANREPRELKQEEFENGLREEQEKVIKNVEALKKEEVLEKQRL